MKRFRIAALGLGLSSCLGLAGLSSLASGQDGKAAADAGSLDTRSKVGYAIGLNLGKNLKAQDIAVDLDLLTRGVKDGFNGSPQILTDEQIQAVMKAFSEDLRSKQMAAQKAAMEKGAASGDKNTREGAAFLAKNKAQPGVITLPSGLQYKVIKEGTGKTPKAEDTVSAHYRGTLIDGTEFDSSYKRGQPLSIPVNGVIAGWTEALLKMKEGAKWQLFIPSNLAYGPSPQPGSPIGPNSTLLFDIELIKVQ